MLTGLEKLREWRKFLRVLLVPCGIWAFLSFWAKSSMNAYSPELGTMQIFLKWGLFFLLLLLSETVSRVVQALEEAEAREKRSKE